jgi:predicted dinucleotide-utilizing enzyme
MAISGPRRPLPISSPARFVVIPRLCVRIEDLLALEPDVVVELAGHAALRRHAPTVLRAGVDVPILAVGALADPDTGRAIRDAAHAGKSRAGAA